MPAAGVPAGTQRKPMPVTGAAEDETNQMAGEAFI